MLHDFDEPDLVPDCSHPITWEPETAMTGEEIAASDSISMRGSIPGKYVCPECGSPALLNLTP